MRVCHVITDLGLGGAEVMLSRLLEALGAGDSQHLVIALGCGGPIAARIAGLGVPVHTIGLPKVSAVADAARAARNARQFAPDVVHGWMYHGNLAALAVAGACADSPPVVWGIHASVHSGMREKRATTVVKQLGARLSRRPARVVYCARASARQHVAYGYEGANAVVVPNGIDLGQFTPRSETGSSNPGTDGAVLVGLVAHYRPEKDHALFLRVAALVAREHDHVRFVLAGRGVDESNVKLVTAIRNAGIDDRVELLGEQADVRPLLARLDINCLSSSTEAFPLSLVEAMACGVPCVATDVGDSDWIVGDTGRVVPSGREGPLARAISELVALGHDGRAALGQRARTRIVTEFSIDRYVASHVALYGDVIAERALRRTGRPARGGAR